MVLVVPGVVVAETEPFSTALTPSQLTIQWQLTESCNLRCRHCYRNNEQSGNAVSGFDSTAYFTDDLRLEAVVQQCLSLRALFVQRLHKQVPLQINLSGGEPFLHPRIGQVLDRLAALRDGHPPEGPVRFTVLTNGTLLGSPELSLLVKARPRFVQLSLDGTRATHDAIRGTGNYKVILKTMRRLTRAGLPLCVSFTAHSDNYFDLPAVEKAARRHGASWGGLVKTNSWC